MSKPPATWRSAWTRFLLCEMRRCKHATVFRFCRASLTALRAPMFESQRDSIIEPKVGRASGLPWVNVQIIHNPEAGCIYFSERGCVQAHQPQHSGKPDASKSPRAAAGLADTAALRRKARTQLLQSCYSCFTVTHHAERLLRRAHVDRLPVAVQHQHNRLVQNVTHTFVKSLNR